jgi:site-specific recombinase XerD
MVKRQCRQIIEEERKIMTKEQILEKMKFDLEARGLSQCTVEDYMAKVRLFQDHFGKPADQMGEDEILAYQHYMLTEKKLKPATVNTYNSALRFVYCVTLDSPLNTKRIPQVKHTRSLPILPTKEELRYLFYLADDNLRNKALFMTIYGAGLRLGEAANLKVCDIDSEKGRIFIRKGKGGRDRYALLPKKALEALRAYWVETQPKEWLFVTKQGTKITEKAITDAWKAIVKRSGIPKRINVHLLRHCFAVHMLDEGNDIFAIKKLLGHVSINSTMWYLQMTDAKTLKLKSPLDNMKERGNA